MPEHPYTKLLEELDGAHYMRFDKGRGLIYAWRGERRVEIFNKEGACVDFFSVTAGADRAEVGTAITKHMSDELE